MHERTARNLRKPRLPRVRKFGEKRQRPKSCGTIPCTVEGQIELDFDSDLTPDQLAIFA